MSDNVTPLKQRQPSETACKPIAVRCNVLGTIRSVSVLLLFINRKSAIVARSTQSADNSFDLCVRKWKPANSWLMDSDD